MFQDSPAEKAGLKIGDRILMLDGEPVNWLGGIGGPPGTRVQFTVQPRDQSKPIDVTVTRAKVKGASNHLALSEIYEDRQGKIWFARKNGNVLCYDREGRNEGEPGTWHRYTEADGLDSGIRQFYQTQDGTLWATTWDKNKGLNRYNPSAGEKNWTRIYLKNYGGNDYHRAIMETRDGTLWVGSTGFLHAYRDTTWTVYKTPDVSVPEDWQGGMIEASDGALWMTDFRRGAYRFAYEDTRWTGYENLRFRAETANSDRWFLAPDSTLVRNSGNTWERFGTADGLMDAPAIMLITREGTVWAVGSHDSTAATAWLDSSQWHLKIHPHLSERILRAYEASDGTLWFGAYSVRSSKGHLGGVLQFDGQTWTHYKPSLAPRQVNSIAQTSDGMLWFGSSNLYQFDGQRWHTPEQGLGEVLSLETDPEDHLWVGTRNVGIARFDGNTWTRYDTEDGLALNLVLLLRHTGRALYAGTPVGISTFDGKTWVTHAFPPEMVTRVRGMTLGKNKTIWLDMRTPETRRWKTVQFVPNPHPPETQITLSLDEVSQPGNTTLAWTGISP